MIEVSFTIPGNPGEARINHARRAGVTRSGKPYSFKTDAASSWAIMAAACARRAWIPLGLDRITGAVAVTLHVYWPRVRRKHPLAGLPMGDIDACIKATLDVLGAKAAGIIIDDAQVTLLAVRNGYDRNLPRIEVRVVERLPAELAGDGA